MYKIRFIQNVCLIHNINIQYYNYGKKEKSLIHTTTLSRKNIKIKTTWSTNKIKSDKNRSKLLCIHTITTRNFW